MLLGPITRFLKAVAFLVMLIKLVWPTSGKGVIWHQRALWGFRPRHSLGIRCLGAFGRGRKMRRPGRKIRRAAFLGSNSQERLRQWHRWELYCGLTRNGEGLKLNPPSGSHLHIEQNQTESCCSWYFSVGSTSDPAAMLAKYIYSEISKHSRDRLLT